MTMETDRLRSLVARLVFCGDFQELMSLYGAADVSLPLDRLVEVYEGYSFTEGGQEALDEIAAAIADDLLPRLDEPVTVPAELIELAARCAVEQSKYHVAVKALREAGALDGASQRYSQYATESLSSGEYDRAAWELIVAGRFGWAGLSAGARAEFVVSLGIDAAELGFALGAQTSRGKVVGGRPLPDFPAWQTYGPLLHARCGIDECVARKGLDETVPLAVRYLIHDRSVAERALEAVAGDAPRLLKALAAASDEGFSEYGERYKTAHARYQELREQWDKGPEEADETDQSLTDSDSESGGESSPDSEREPGTQLDAIREGLQEVQGLLLGRTESRWRNCLAQLAYDHPLSVFTVCTLRGREIEGSVAPVGEPGLEFLRAVLG